MNKQYNNPVIRNATDKVDKLLTYILANSEDDEDWKEIIWADSNYYISNKGRVLSLCNNEPIILKSFMVNGYLRVSICGHDRRINRLVANAFIDNPEKKPIVHHIDNNKANNSIENLAWVTHSENTAAYYNSKRQIKELTESEAQVG